MARLFRSTARRGQWQRFWNYKSTIKTSSLTCNFFLWLLLFGLTLIGYRNFDVIHPRDQLFNQLHEEDHLDKINRPFQQRHLFALDNIESKNVTNYDIHCKVKQNNLTLQLGHGPVWEQCDMEKSVPNWGIFIGIYVFITFIIFVALAIVCDDFFVPSLEAISEKLKLSEDVAGATFMAAGSSAPELFSSIAAVTFQSDVGVGTIMGSAVFNLLVIVSLTAAFAGKILNLDWRPLLRDSIFYAISIIFFIYSVWDTKFDWWEALFMLVLYAFYIVIMMLNERVMRGLSSMQKLFGSKGQPSSENGSGTNADLSNISTERKVSLVGGHARRLSLHSQNSLKTGPATPAIEVAKVFHHDRRNSVIHSIATSRRSLRGDEVAFFKTPRNSSLPPHNLPSDAEHCINGLPNGSSISNLSHDSVVSSEFAHQLHRHQGSFKSQEEFDECHATEHGFLKMHHSEEQPLINAESGGAPRGLVHGRTSVREKRVDEVNMKPLTEDDEEMAMVAVDAVGENNRMPEVEIHFLKNEKTLLDDEEEKKEVDEGDEEDPRIECCCRCCRCCPSIRGSPPVKPSIDLEANCSAQLSNSAVYILKWSLYIFAFPFLCLFSWTIPECSKEHNRKWYLVSFFTSVLWIAALSFLMVTIVARMGCLIGIDSYVMSLVVLAAGTSIPDLLSSIIVARDGFGDMAVSNAIGSNVFDIDLGLGLPFLCRIIAELGKPFDIFSQTERNIYCIGGMLFMPHAKFGFILLIVLVIAMIVFILAGFKLGKGLGITFFLMYLVFLSYAFFQEFMCNKTLKFNC